MTRTSGLITAAIAAMLLLAVAASTRQPSSDRVFAVQYAKAELWSDGAVREPAIARHRTYVEALGGRVLGGGPFVADAGAEGMVVVLAESSDELEAWALQDPAVRNGVLRAEVREWRVETLNGSPIERPHRPLENLRAPQLSRLPYRSARMQ